MRLQRQQKHLHSATTCNSHLIPATTTPSIFINVQQENILYQHRIIEPQTTLQSLYTKYIQQFLRFSIYCWPKWASNSKGSLAGPIGLARYLLLALLGQSDIYCWPSKRLKNLKTWRKMCQNPLNVFPVKELFIING